MGLGVKIIIQKEASGEGDLELSKEKKNLILLFAGLQLSNFFEPAVKGDQFCFGHVIIMLIMDTILYMSITLFMEMLLTSNSWSIGKARGQWAI
jgi:hypothetical protein